MRAGSVALSILMLIAFHASDVRAAPCIAPPLTPAVIEQFKAGPDALVAPNADTRTIEVQVRDLAGTDANLAVDLVGLAKTTSPRFRTAIAAGLAQAAIACQTIDQQAALTIQQAVASFEEEGFQNSFAAVSGDLSTAATLAATSSANSSVGSVVVVNPTGGGRATTNPGGGGTTAFFQINSSSIGVSSRSTTPTNTTTSANPVSATR